ncbi:hypothetical protein [Vibrio sp. ER1A]|uniref:hypothetical protein n=1 Tax=Vibrio sp. ER1A TaxID=1517681 RepID=UPI0005720752|nr:hypothetical protein [Vibrio sp. ER1A]
MNTAEKLQPQHQAKIHGRASNQPVDCICGHRICDERGVIRSRCVKIHEGTALCRCKRWVEVPIGKKA